MKHIQLKTISDPYFQQTWALYEDAFPIEERRTLDLQTRVLKNNKYHFDAVIDNNQFIGFKILACYYIYNYAKYAVFAILLIQRICTIIYIMLNRKFII